MPLTLYAGSIYDHFTNMWAVFNLTGASDPAIQFLKEQRAWATEQAGSDETQTSPFWAATRLILAQFDGMLEVSHLHNVRAPLVPYATTSVGMLLLLLPVAAP
jgi:hypothetical protein